MDDVVILPAFCLRLIDSWWAHSAIEERPKEPYDLRHDIAQWCKESMKQRHHIMYLTSRLRPDDSQRRLATSVPYIVFENRADMTMFRIAYPEITKET